MKKRVFKVFILAILVSAVVVVSACSNEAEILQARVDSLESENSTLQATVSSLSTDLEVALSTLSFTQNELQNLQAILADNADSSQQGSQDGELAITYGGQPNKDMSWPFGYGKLEVGLRINLNELDEDDEIVWSSTSNDIFTVVQSDDGTSATVTPVDVGSAQLVVKVGDRETRSWVRITS